MWLQRTTASPRPFSMHRIYIVVRDQRRMWKLEFFLGSTRLEVDSSLETASSSRGGAGEIGSVPELGGACRIDQTVYRVYFRHHHQNTSMSCALSCATHQRTTSLTIPSKMVVLELACATAHASALTASKSSARQLGDKAVQTARATARARSRCF